MALFDLFKKKPKETQPAPAPEPAPVQTKPKKAEKTMETQRVAGTSFRAEEIESVGIYNSQYDYSVKEIKDEGLEDERIYEYDFLIYNATLVPEPENEHDPNAIAVYIDDTQIGYIKSSSTAHIRKLINSNKIKSIDCEIGGGKYKYYDSDDKHLEKNETNYWAELTIYLVSEGK